MKKSHTKSGASGAGHGNRVEIGEILQKIENHLKRTRSIGWIMFKKLESIDESIAIFAGQKKREITPESPDGAQAQ